MMSNPFDLFHAGNHGDYDNPHSQYAEYMLETPMNASVKSNPAEWVIISNQTFYTDIYGDNHPTTVISAPTPQKYLLTFLLHSIYADSEFYSALVSIRMNLYASANRYSVHLIPLITNDNLSGTQQRYDDIIRLYTIDNQDGSYTIQIALRYVSSYMAWKIKILDCSFIDTGITFKNTDTIRGFMGFPSRDNLYIRSSWLFVKKENQRIINETTLPVVGQWISMFSNIINGVTNICTKLPLASQSNVGKVYYLDDGTSLPDFHFSRKTTVGYEWAKLTPPIISSVVNNSMSTSLDASSDVILLTNSQPVSSIINGKEGKELTVISYGSNTTFIHSSSLQLLGECNVTLCRNISSITFKMIKGTWMEIGRNGNNSILTSNSDVNIGKWTKVATVTLNSLFSFESMKWSIIGGQTGQVGCAVGDVFLSVKQGSTMGTQPTIRLVMNAHNNFFFKEDVVAISTVTPTTTSVDVYVRIQASYEQLSMNMYHQYRTGSGNTALKGMQPLLTTLPSGIVSSCTYPDVIIHSTNGTKFRIDVSDAGVITTTKI